MKVTAEINSSTSPGEKIALELENQSKHVNVSHLLSVETTEMIKETFSVEEVFNELDEKLKEHYGLKK